MKWTIEEHSNMQAYMGKACDRTCMYTQELGKAKAFISVE